MQTQINKSNCNVTKRRKKKSQTNKIHKNASLLKVHCKSIFKRKTKKTTTTQAKLNKHTHRHNWLR